MRKEIIEVYEFEELSKEAQEVAIEQYRDSMDFHIESEMITEDFTEILQELGYPTDDLEWRLSYSQGDGVAFYGSVDMETVVPRLMKEGYDFDYDLYNQIVEDFTIMATIERNSFGHHYSHYNTMYVEVESDDIDLIVEDIFGLDMDDEGYDEHVDLVEELMSDLERCIVEDVQETSRKLEKDGYAQMEYFTSDEAIKENIITNEYEFTSDGKQYYY